MIFEELFIHFFTSMEDYYPDYPTFLNKMLKFFEKIHLLYLTYPEARVRLEKFSYEDFNKRYETKVPVIKNGGVLRALINICFYIIKNTQNIEIH